MSGVKGMKHRTVAMSDRKIGYLLTKKILREKMKFLGMEGLFNVIAKKANHVKVTDALIQLRNRYILDNFTAEKTYTPTIYKVGHYKTSSRRSV